MNDYESNYLTSARENQPASPFCIQWIIKCLGVLQSWKDVFSKNIFKMDCFYCDQFMNLLNWKINFSCHQYYTYLCISIMLMFFNVCLNFNKLFVCVWRGTKWAVELRDLKILKIFFPSDWVFSYHQRLRSEVKRSTWSRLLP